MLGIAAKIRAAVVKKLLTFFSVSSRVLIPIQHAQSALANPHSLDLALWTITWNHHFENAPQEHTVTHRCRITKGVTVYKEVIQRKVVQYFIRQHTSAYASFFLRD